MFSVFRYWRRLYNRFDRELHPRQSELDCLMAIKEETQQLEEELAVYEQVQHQIFAIIFIILFQISFEFQ